MTKFAAAVFSASKAGVEDAERKMLPRKPYLGPADADKARCRQLMEEVAGLEQSLAEETKALTRVHSGE
ncbi:hypothetical protein MAPG_02840 [Magnaporthiopsis poae ATCC 64411]|uniref:Uncharacterized protein n=1 Tax=Magnaporthiopsis poae (strain ATCC 64411 / 73-15) TaxID=644358 RepID=A0A0C4DSG1_MAGP6|nr:hypothetical protein MAPG_02840 [Magnaporthiopsis poae ATCC 64411]